MGYEFSAFLRMSIYAIPHFVGFILCLVYLRRSHSLQAGLMAIGSSLALASRLAQYTAMSFFMRSLATNIASITQLTKGCQYGEMAGYSLF